MNTLNAFRIRIAADITKTDPATDQLRSDEADTQLQFRAGDPVRIELAMLADNALVDITSVAQVTLEIKPADTRTQEAEATSVTTFVAPPTATRPIIRVTVPAAELNPALTQVQWENGDADAAHAIIRLDSDTTRLATGMRWLSIGVITTDAPEQERTVASGPVRILGGGIATDSQPSQVIADQFYTKTETKNLYLQQASNLADIGSASAARINLGLDIGSEVQAHSSKLTQLAMGFPGSVNWSDLNPAGSSLADLNHRDFADLTQRPNSLAGYGIQNAMTDLEITSQQLRLLPGVRFDGVSTQALLPASNALREWTLLTNLPIPTDAEIAMQNSRVGLFAFTPTASVAAGGTASAAHALVGYLENNGDLVIELYDGSGNTNHFRRLRYARSELASMAGLQVRIALVWDVFSTPKLYAGRATTPVQAIESTGGGGNAPTDWSILATDFLHLGHGLDSHSRFRGDTFGHLMLLDIALSPTAATSPIDYSIEAHFAGIPLPNSLAVTVNEEHSDFSSGTYGYISGTADLTGNTDANADGPGNPPSDNWLKYVYTNTLSDDHGPYKSQQQYDAIAVGVALRVTMEVFRPTGSAIASLRAGRSTNSLLGQAQPLIEGTVNELRWLALNPSVRQTFVFFINNGVGSGQVCYLRNIRIDRVGVRANLHYRDLTGSGINDRSVNGNDMQFSGNVIALN